MVKDHLIEQSVNWRLLHSLDGKATE